MISVDSHGSQAVSAFRAVEPSPTFSSARMPKAARAISAHLRHARPPTNAFCVTLYNEDAPSLLRTLESIFRAVDACQESSPQQGAYSTVCVIADGKDKVSHGIFEWMRLARVITPEGLIEDADVETYCSFHSLGRLIHRAQAEARLPVNNSMREVQVVVCFKQKNKGKLDSHALFFNDLCRMLDPKYCYQIDTGTVLDHLAIAELTERLETSQSTAAVAPRVLTEIPDPRVSLMTEWQFSDLAYRNSVHWAAESLTGFLSVIPGQTGVFRWGALTTETRTRDDVVTEYLQGAGADGPVTRTTYLAEDRVMGILLMCADRQDWHLEYAPKAIATTDRCHSWDELLRQRRRWNNSAFACRLWLLNALFSFLRTADKSPGDKARLSFAAALQALVGIREFAVPANVVALAVALIQPLFTTSSPLLKATCVAFWAVTLLNLVLEFALPTEIPAASSSPAARIRGATRWPSAILFFATILLLPWKTTLLLLFPALSLIAIFLVVSRRALPTMVRAQFLPFQNLGVQLVTQTYAFWRLDDISWGTKGLRSSDADQATLRRLRGFRSVVISSWIAFNALLCLSIVAEGPRDSGLSRILEVCCIVDGALSILAIAYLLTRKLAESK